MTNGPDGSARTSGADGSAGTPGPDPPPGAPDGPGIVADSSAPALTDQLARLWASIPQACDGLDARQWALATECPGWTVADQVAHIIGTESMLAGRPSPPSSDAEPPAHVHNDIGRFNEAWLDRYRALGTDHLLADLHEITAERLQRLRAMTEADFDEPSWTPVGKADYRRFMQVRVFDCWVHEQDIRLALGRPGHLDGPAAEQALDEVVRGLGYIVGKRAGAPAGSRVRLAVHGPLERTVDVAVDGRAAVVPVDGTPATTALRLRSDCLLRLACGRRSPLAALEAGDVVVTGDVDLGRRVAENLAFTI